MSLKSHTTARRVVFNSSLEGLEADNHIYTRKRELGMIPVDESYSIGPLPCKMPIPAPLGAEDDDEMQQRSSAQ